MQQVNLTEARLHLPELIEAAIKGEEVLIAQDEQHVVKLVPVNGQAAIQSPHPQFGSARGLISMREDFDDPLEEFTEYMQ